MNKKVIAAIAAAVVLGVAGFLIFGSKNDDSVTTETGNSTVSRQSSDSTEPNVKAACDILTKATAESLIGPVGDETQPAPTQSTSLQVSTCNYLQNTDAMPVSEIKNAMQVSVLARSAKDADGVRSNKAQFEAAGKPAGAQDVSGYGDKAYWYPEMGQFNILKGGNWYILTYGSSANPAANTLENAKKLAEAVKDRL